VAPLVAQVLINRGLDSPAAVGSFLETRLDDLQPPLALPQMDRAVTRIARAAIDREPITIYGDYDADGITAAAIMALALRRLGAAVDFYIPDRHAEGYGLHPAAVTRLASSGTRLLVAVDCGTTSVAAGRAAADAGIDLVILDHHVPTGPVPQAVAVVNPVLSGALSDYCAAGLAYQAVRGIIDAMGQGDEGPDLLGLAALGTVADAVRLLGDNRIIVAQGLARLGEPGSPGLRALIEVAGVGPPLRVRDVSHALAPRLNAAGRLASAASALRLLVGEDPQECRALAVDLDRLNQERRALCDRVLAEAVEEVERTGMAAFPAIVLAREGWHPGVVGIVASQIVERYYRPTVLIALRGGLGRGSARSIPPLHLVNALAAASADLTAFGGHAMAAGLTIEAGAVPRFREAFLAAASAALGKEDLEPLVEVDAEVGLESLTPELAAEIKRLSPFGPGNPRPVFLTRDLHAVSTRLVGGGAHLRLTLSDGRRAAEAVGFRLGDQAELLAFTQARIDLAYGIEPDTWQDPPSFQMVVERLWTPGVDPAAVAADTGQVLARLFARAGDYLDPSRVGVEHAPAFHTKVVGVTFEGRQALVPQVRPGERVRLVRDPRNPRDPHAVKVSLQDGRQIGFLRAALAARLAPAMDAGARYRATATAVTGGGDRAYGLNLLIEREAAWSGEPEEEDALPASGLVGPETAARLTALVLRGRRLSAVHKEALDILLGGGRAAIRLGPGSGLVPAVALASAALVATGRGPVAVVLPRASEAEAFCGLVAPWLATVGMRAVVVHGALEASQASRDGSVVERGGAQVVFASAEWARAYVPSVGSLVVVADHISAADDLGSLGTLYGDSIRLAAGPLPADLLREAASALGLAVLAPRPESRVDLRIVDRRGRPVPRTLAGEVGPRDRILMLAPGPREAVALAAGLREESPELAPRTAYYHAGLPAALRRVLEDLYAAGRIAVLVTGSLVVGPSLPASVSRIRVLGIPSTRLLAAEALGAGGNGCVVELCYAPKALAAAGRALEARHPSRETLARCYHHLRRAYPGGSWTWTSRPNGAAQADEIPTETLAAALEVLVQAGVLAREDIDDVRVRFAFIERGGKADLRRSLRYREGVRERQAAADLAAWAAGPAQEILAHLASI
jgi:single-stranded-DNA-specific exonuclease